MGAGKADKGTRCARCDRREDHREHAGRSLLEPFRALAEYSCISVRSLRDHLIDPAHPLPCYRIGGKVLVRRSEFDAWAGQFRRVGGLDMWRNDIDRILQAANAEPPLAAASRRLAAQASQDRPGAARSPRDRSSSWHQVRRALRNVVLGELCSVHGLPRRVLQDADLWLHDHDGGSPATQQPVSGDQVDVMDSIAQEAWSSPARSIQPAVNATAYLGERSPGPM